MIEVSGRELDRLRMLVRIEAGELTIQEASKELDLSTRQVSRILNRFRREGASSVAHRLRGRPSNRKIGLVERNHIIGIVEREYPDFGPTLASEKLRDLHGISISREPLRKWMIEAGLWVPRNRRRHYHRSRRRRN